jgi:hypothetical protein
VLSVWGSDKRRSRHHIFSPYGTALHLDRRAFDEALALAARDAGADLKLGCNARFTAQPGGGYMVQLSTGERLFSNVAILATGRAGGGLGLPSPKRASHVKTSSVLAKQERRQRAQRFLRDALAHGPKRVSDVEEAAAKAHIETHALEQARADLGIVTSRANAGGGNSLSVQWSLPG